MLHIQSLDTVLITPSWLVNLKITINTNKNNSYCNKMVFCYHIEADCTSLESDKLCYLRRSIHRRHLPCLRPAPVALLENSAENISKTK